MSLRHALLGLLAEGPHSGYDLARRFAGSAGHVWTAGHSQIYPELARLEEVGLIRRAGTGPRGRRTCTITARGRDELRRWLLETEPDRTERSEPMLRIFFLWLLDPDQARDHMLREAAYHREMLERYEAIARERSSPDGRDDSFAIALEWGLRFAREKARWAEWAADEYAAKATALGKVGQAGRRR